MALEREKDEAIALLISQIEVEEQLVELYDETADLIVSVQVRRLLHSIQLDSKKHIEICKTAIELLGGEDFGREDRTELSVGLERHMELERASLERASLLSRNPWIRDNEGLKRLIGRWMEEEGEHHRTLQRLSTERFRREILTDALTGYRSIAIEKLRRELGGLRKKG